MSTCPLGAAGIGLAPTGTWWKRRLRLRAVEGQVPRIEKCHHLQGPVMVSNTLCFLSGDHTGPTTHNTTFLSTDIICGFNVNVQNKINF